MESEHLALFFAACGELGVPDQEISLPVRLYEVAEMDAAFGGWGWQRNASAGGENP